MTPSSKRGSLANRVSRFHNRPRRRSPPPWRGTLAPYLVASFVQLRHLGPQIVVRRPELNQESDHLSLGHPRPHRTILRHGLEATMQRAGHEQRHALCSLLGVGACVSWSCRCRPAESRAALVPHRFGQTIQVDLRHLTPPPFQAAGGGPAPTRSAPAQAAGRSPLRWIPGTATVMALGARHQRSGETRATTPAT